MNTQYSASAIQPAPVSPEQALHRTFGGHHVYAATAFGWYRLICWLQAGQWQWRLESPEGQRTAVGYAQLEALRKQGLLYLAHEDDIHDTPLPMGEAGREAAHELHVEIARAGVRDHYGFAAQALRKDRVHRLSLLTVAQRNTVRNALRDRGLSRRAPGRRASASAA